MKIYAKKGEPSSSFMKDIKREIMCYFPRGRMLQEAELQDTVYMSCIVRIDASKNEMKMY